jgi:hypothetical protein
MGYGFDIRSAGISDSSPAFYGNGDVVHSNIHRISMLPGSWPAVSTAGRLLKKDSPSGTTESPAVPAGLVGNLHGPGVDNAGLLSESPCRDWGNPFPDLFKN